MFPFELLSMPDRTVNSNQGFSNMDYLAVPRSECRAALSISGLPCVAKTDQGEQIKGWSAALNTIPCLLGSCQNQKNLEIIPPDHNLQQQQQCVVELLNPRAIYNDDASM